MSPTVLPSYLVGRRLADLRVDQGTTEGEFGEYTSSLPSDMPFLAGGDQERLGVALVVVVVHLDHGAGQGDAGLLGRLADFGVVEQWQLTDPGLLLTLLRGAAW